MNMRLIFIGKQIAHSIISGFANGWQLYSLMQRQDSDINRSIALDSKRLAESSTRVALETKKLAEASRSDTSSMKTIAALTMLFLPGTAIAVCRSSFFHPFSEKLPVRLL